MGRSEREEIEVIRIALKLATAQARDLARQFNDELARAEALSKRIVELEHQLEVWACENCGCLRCS